MIINDLLVKGSARVIDKIYANKIEGDLIGNADSASVATELGTQPQLTSKSAMDGFLSGTGVRYATFNTSESGTGFQSNDGMILSLPWTNSTAYGAQIAFDDALVTNVAIRGKGETWGDWYRLLHTGNFTSHITPSAIGAAESGHSHTVVNGVTPEWSGTIDYADASFVAAWTNDGTKIKALSKTSLLQSLKYPSRLSSDTDIDNFLEIDTFKVTRWSDTSTPGVSNGIILSSGWSSTDYGFQLAIDDDPTYYMALRQRNGDGWKAWKRIPMGDGTGASGTWNISIGGTAARANYLNYTNSNEINFIGNTNATEIYFNYREPSTGNTSGNTAITKYYFANRNTSTSGVELIADKFTGYATKNTKHISLTEQCQLTSYRKTVIALCLAPTTANSNINSYSSGRITMQRTNALYSPMIADISIAAAYGAIGQIRTRFIRNNGFQIFKPCVFTYNGVKYGGIEVKTSDAEASRVTFDGTTTFDIFGLDYYDTNTSSVLNQEVYDSITYDTVIIEKGWHDGENEFITTYNIGSQSVNYANSSATATKATQDASGNTITSTYATKTELANKVKIVRW